MVYKLHIPENEQPSFGIYHSKLNDFANCTALSDNQLFVRCRRLGDEKGSIKLLVRPTNGSLKSRSSFDAHQFSPQVIEPLRVSIPLAHPKPSSHSPRAMAPSPRTESAPPLIVREAPRISQSDPSNNTSQNLNYGTQSPGLPQVFSTDSVRSRSSSLINIPNRRTSDSFASPAALLAYKHRSRYVASNPSTGAHFSAPGGSSLNTPHLSPSQPPKEVVTCLEPYAPFETGTTGFTRKHKEEDRHKKLLENISLPPVGQPFRSAENPALPTKCAHIIPHQNKQGIKSRNETRLVRNASVPNSSSAERPTILPVGDSSGHDVDISRYEIVNGEAKPPRSPFTISGEMSTTEILGHLRDHGCRNVTDQLSGCEVTEYPVSNGGFGDIYRAKLPSGSRVGLKCVRLCIESTNDGWKKLKRTSRELYTWSKCQHPNILELIGVTEYRGQIAMVSPWMQNGDLSRFLSKKPQVNRCLLCVKIADGVVYLHKSGIVHGDLKGANILISDDFTPKITDFGGAYLKNYSLQFSTTKDRPGFSVRWAAPEVIEGEIQEIPAKADVYSLAMTILEVISGEPPYACVKRDLSVMNRVMSKRHPTRPEGYIPTTSRQGDTLWNLFTRCWAYDSQDRPDALTVRNIVATITPEGLC